MTMNIFKRNWKKSSTFTRTGSTSGSAMVEGPRDALSVEILQGQNIPFEN